VGRRAANLVYRHKNVIISLLPSNCTIKLGRYKNFRVGKNSAENLYDGTQYDDEIWDTDDAFDFDWQLERVRRVLEGPAFAPLRMTMWKPVLRPDERQQNPGFLDHMKILFCNTLEHFGFIPSLEGVPMAQVVSTFNGTLTHFISKILDGNLAELAGRPLFLLLQNYFQQYGPVFKLAFGPKSFLVISDPAMAKYVLKENPTNYDKGNFNKNPVHTLLRCGYPPWVT